MKKSKCVNCGREMLYEIPEGVTKVAVCGECGGIAGFTGDGVPFGLVNAEAPETAIDARGSMNEHRRGHWVNKDGRCPQLEKWNDEAFHQMEGIVWERSMRWPRRVLDLGCSYGYMLHLASRCWKSEVLGVDLPGTLSSFDDVTVWQQAMESPYIPAKVTRRLGGAPELVILNHSLEHSQRPAEVRMNLEVMANANEQMLVWVSVPSAGSAWECWSSHETLWNERFLRAWMARSRFQTLWSQTVERRWGQLEASGLFCRRMTVGEVAR